MSSTGKILLLGILCFIILYGFSPCPAYASELGAQESADVTGATTCVVSFDGNGANASLATITVSSDGYYGTLPELTRPNYVFKGWYSFRSGGVKITETTKVIKPTNHTLYAQWRGNPVEIELDATGGSLSKTKVIVYYGSKYLRQLPTPTRAGYQFDGWYTSETDGDKVTVRSIYGEDGPETLYAHWTEKPVKVIFIAFNGEVYERIVSYQREYGELPVPEKEGYSFGGWYKYKDYKDRDDGQKQITESTIVTETALVKLYARWYPVPDNGNSLY